MVVVPCYPGASGACAVGEASNPPERQMRGRVAEEAGALTRDLAAELSGLGVAAQSM